MSNIYQFEAELLEGDVKALADYKGKVMLIVNTASKCAFTHSLQDLKNYMKNINHRVWKFWGFHVTSLVGRIQEQIKK